jgi:hypothetical protein
VSQDQTGSPSAFQSESLAPSLAQVQEHLARYLLAEKRHDADACVAWIAPGKQQVSGAEQLAVYRQLLRANHTQVLQDTYPACYALVGEAYFRQIGACYFSRYPTVDANLNRYGGEFAALLAALAPERSELAPMPYLSDLARLEWVWQQLSEQEDPDVLDIQALAAVPATQHGALHFLCNPTLVLLQCDYEVHRLWDGVLQDDELPAPQLQATSLALWKHGGQRHIRQLGAAELAWLEMFLAAGLGGEKGWGDAAVLQMALVAGWISGFSLERGEAVQ